MKKAAKAGLEALRIKAQNCEKEEYQIRPCLRLYVFNTSSRIFLTMILILILCFHVMTQLVVFSEQRLHKEGLLLVPPRGITTTSARLVPRNLIQQQ